MAAPGGPRGEAPDPERLLAEERVRIGRDLHDVVIRSIFGVSLKLSGAVAMIQERHAALRVEEAIAELDHTVKLIRSVVFGLERGPLPQGRLARQEPDE